MSPDIRLGERAQWPALPGGYFDRDLVQKGVGRRATFYKIFKSPRRQFRSGSPSEIKPGVPQALKRRGGILLVFWMFDRLTYHGRSRLACRDNDRGDIRVVRDRGKPDRNDEPVPGDLYTAEIGCGRRLRLIV